MDEAQLYAAFQQEMQPYKALMAKATDTVIEQDISKYPIFVVYQESAIDVGVKVSQSVQSGQKWSVNASTLEEFVAKSLIQAEKIEDFKSVYKKPETHFCVFVVRKIGARFVFIPRS